MEIEHSAASIFQYHFALQIKQSAEQVWDIMFKQIDHWWMKEFRALSENSTMHFDCNANGTLTEVGVNGETLEWYRMQMCIPGESVHLVGNLAPDWGGPTTSMLKLALQPDGDHCRLIVTDALLGNVTLSKAQSAQRGWQELFEKGLKDYAQRS